MFKPLKKQRSYEGLPRPGDLAREFLVKGFGEMKRFRPSELIQEDSVCVCGGGGTENRHPFLLSFPYPPRSYLFPGRRFPATGKRACLQTMGSR